MKKIILFLFSSLFTITSIIAQKPYAAIKRTEILPIIDGMIDDVWTTANEYNIAVPFRTETPTLGNPGETTWKAFWDFRYGIYLLIKVTDDVWSPVYAGTSPNDSLFYDHPEIYFDSNYILNDGKGTNPDGNGGGNGHHLFSLSPLKGEVNGGFISESNGATYSYQVTETGYYVECFIPFSRLNDCDDVSLDKTIQFGFDITIIDNDNEIPIRNRMSWVNNGANDENRNNMDDAGLFVFEYDLYPTAFISKITLLPGAISTDGGTLQMEPVIEPVWATNQKLKWVVVNKTGKATIDSKGLVTAVSNGTVEVQATATDGGLAQASAEIVITGQIIDQVEVWTNNNPLIIYPNPTSGEVKLIFNRVPDQKTNLIISDLSGKTIIKQQIRDKEVLIDLSGNPKGVYLLRTSDSSSMGKIILQ